MPAHPPRNPSSPFASFAGHHVGVRVPDYEAAKAWYTEKLDFRVPPPGVLPGSVRQSDRTLADAPGRRRLTSGGVGPGIPSRDSGPGRSPERGRCRRRGSPGRWRFGGAACHGRQRVRGPAGDVQPVAQRFVAQPLGRQLEDLELARGHTQRAQAPLDPVGAGPALATAVSPRWKKYSSAWASQSAGSPQLPAIAASATSRNPR